MRGKPFPRPSIHKKLAWNLAAVGIALSTALAGAVLFVRWNQLGAVVVDRALLSAAIFSAQVEPLLESDRPARRDEIQRALETLVSRVRDPKIGRFVQITLYDKDLSKLAEHSDSDYPAIDAITARTARRGVRQFQPGRTDSEIFVAAGTPHVRVAVPLTDGEGNVLAFGEGVFAPSKQTLWAVRGGAIRTVFVTAGVVLVTTLVLYPVIVRLLRRVTGLSMELMDSHVETLKVLGSAIAKRDSDTDAHNYRVTILSVRIAEAVGLDTGEIRSLIKGAFLHDVGKIGIPDDILLKPGQLTDEEFERMRTHVDHGIEIVGRAKWLQDALQVVGCHHEKVDGTGYPRGLCGDESPATARIFAIADVFDALTSRRPYKEPLSFEETMKILKASRGNHFDARFLDAFERISRSAYDELGGREDAGLRRELADLVQRYFAKDPKALSV